MIFFNFRLNYKYFRYFDISCFYKFIISSYNRRPLFIFVMNIKIPDYENNV